MFGKCRKHRPYSANGTAGGTPASDPLWPSTKYVVVVLFIHAAIIGFPLDVFVHGLVLLRRRNQTRDDHLVVGILHRHESKYAVPLPFEVGAVYAEYLHFPPAKQDGKIAQDGKGAVI